MLASCGIRKPLMKPKDIPAYEAKRARKQQQLEDDLQNPQAPIIEDSIPEGAPVTPPQSAQ